MLVTIASYDICDGTLEGGVAISDLRAVLDRIFDVVVPIGAGSGSICSGSGWTPVAYDRNITKCDFTFIVKRVHDSLAASEAFILGLECNLPRRGTVQLIGFDGTTLNISNGCLVNHSLVQQIGATTFHSYHIIGSGVITVTGGD